MSECKHECGSRYVTNWEQRVHEQKCRKKPPIGPIPEWKWKEDRLLELSRAMVEYDQAGYDRNPEWDKEFVKLYLWSLRNNGKIATLDLLESNPCCEIPLAETQECVLSFEPMFIDYIDLIK